MIWVPKGAITSAPKEAWKLKLPARPTDRDGQTSS